eukprot:Gregarina_sp_Pseudo_9__5915@NODE_940_length_2045_cov_335_887338_g882_i0_p2_GENE_NODE_940_length_2045_cov_335_887338_g882_i0NODE_940_length_2045_cov_335_887338_g882_i0_p2_ORF_typecomplete_len145_score0_16Myb_Cef/PF11831_8/0_033Auts2/PF15336_6/0_071Rtt102p/PF09510_10/7e02Rtt102p/PF09510_10/0_35DUF3915/PF13054_6/0_44_NODE_940_length_2045_cov_335_887338_g882_i0217651
MCAPLILILGISFQTLRLGLVILAESGHSLTFAGIVGSVGEAVVPSKGHAGRSGSDQMSHAEADKLDTDHVLDLGKYQRRERQEREKEREKERRRVMRQREDPLAPSLLSRTHFSLPFLGGGYITSLGAGSNIQTFHGGVTTHI